MAPRHSDPGLTTDELRRMLVEKRRAERQQRLEHFRQTGRVVVLTPEHQQTTLEDLHPENVPGERTGSGPSLAEAAKKRRKDVFDRILLFVEILAVIGLIFTVVNGVRILRDLNREVSSAMVQPSASPTALIVAVVLPSGHTPPDASGRTQPNEAEIPEHLRPLVQSLAQAPVPTPGPEHAVRIQIPAIDVDAPIVQGDGWEQLKKGVGQHIGSANPGQDGNLVLSAHNDIFGEIFRSLDRLQPGDHVQVSTSQRTFIYAVTSTQLVEPTQVDVLAASAQPQLTLISCYPYLVDSQRIVVSASLVE